MLFSLCVLVRFWYQVQAEETKVVLVQVAQTTSLAFDKPIAKKLMLRRRKADINKKLL